LGLGSVTVRVSARNTDWRGAAGQGTARGRSTAQIYLYIGRKLFLVISNLNYLSRAEIAHNFMLISMLYSEWQINGQSIIIV
jgi:hypothetical protein